MSLIKINNLTAYYDKIEALHGVSLHIDQGEMVSLIGPNGAGKTTLLRAISGLIRRSGEIDLEGQNIALLKPQKIVSLGIVQSAEGRQLFPDMSVADNLKLGAFLRSDTVEIMRDYDRILDLFPVLAERSTQKAGTMSGGEQQMLAIGRALMSRPRVLMLDEPSFGIAPLIVERIFNVIRQLNKYGLTTFVVEQNVPLALEISTRTYVLEEGRIVMSGDSASLENDESIRRAYLGM